MYEKYLLDRCLLKKLPEEAWLARKIQFSDVGVEDLLLDQESNRYGTLTGYLEVKFLDSKLSGIEVGGRKYVAIRDNGKEYSLYVYQPVSKSYFRSTLFTTELENQTFISSIYISKAREIIVDY